MDWEKASFTPDFVTSADPFNAGIHRVHYIHPDGLRLVLIQETISHDEALRVSQEMRRRLREGKPGDHLFSLDGRYIGFIDAEGKLSVPSVHAAPAPATHLSIPETQGNAQPANAPAGKTLLSRPMRHRRSSEYQMWRAAYISDISMKQTVTIVHAHGKVSGIEALPAWVMKLHKATCPDATIYYAGSNATAVPAGTRDLSVLKDWLEMHQILGKNRVRDLVVWNCIGNPHNTRLDNDVIKIGVKAKYGAVFSLVIFEHCQPNTTPVYTRDSLQRYYPENDIAVVTLLGLKKENSLD